ncbi:type I restriction enzyme, R subunit [Nitrosomonas communis]|uniref:Type I restriction enzyme, R subunit n=1 Tax=Nitrosomonas communis TaxID=44574 RepID=A0A1H2RPI0_9PROT|nr:type I restriction enzyme, R subunit [Nitrosomonas communis]
MPPELPDSAIPEKDFKYAQAGSDQTWAGINEGEEGESIRRYVVANVEVKVVAERVQYFDTNGKLITESLKDYTRKTLAQSFASMDDFLRRWNSAAKKQAVIEELANEGIFFDALAEEISRECDLFDLICHIAWGKPPLTRRERAEQVKKRHYFTRYGEQARRVLEALLDKYADEGVTQIEETQILTVSPFIQFGTPIEIIRAFGDLEHYQQAVQELEQMLYSI